MSELYLLLKVISASGMILALSVAFKLRPVKVDFTQIAAAVAESLIVEMGGRRMAALASGGDGAGVYSGAKLHHGYEAVARGAVPFLGSGVRMCAKGGERAPHPGGKGNRNTWSGVVERLHDIAGEALEAINVAPRCAPSAKLGNEFVRGVRETLQQFAGRYFAGGVILR